MLKLVGPFARKTFDGLIVEIWTVQGSEDRWIKGDKVKFRRLALEAYEARPPHAPNPALVPLDESEEGGPFVYALIKLEMPNAEPGADPRA